MPAFRLLLPAALASMLLSGCSQGSEEFDSTRDDPNPVLEPLVRTPSPLPADAPQTDPPLVQELPGASGGPPGSPDASFPPASPGG